TMRVATKPPPRCGRSTRPRAWRGEMRRVLRVACRVSRVARHPSLVTHHLVLGSFRVRSILVLTDEQRRELIEKIRVFPTQLRARVGGLTDEQLTTHFLEGE